MVRLTFAHARSALTIIQRSPWSVTNTFSSLSSPARSAGQSVRVRRATIRLDMPSICGISDSMHCNRGWGGNSLAMKFA